MQPTFFDLRVPPRGQQKGARRCRQVEANAAGAQGHEKHAVLRLVMEFIQHHLPRFLVHGSVQAQKDNAVRREHLLDKNKWNENRKRAKK
jgi:hypothetical protein